MNIVLGVIIHVELQNAQSRNYARKETKTTGRLTYNVEEVNEANGNQYCVKNGISRKKKDLKSTTPLKLLVKKIFPGSRAVGEKDVSGKHDMKTETKELWERKRTSQSCSRVRIIHGNRDRTFTIRQLGNLWQRNILSLLGVFVVWVCGQAPNESKKSNS